MTSKRVGNASSKYDFDPTGEEFEKDVLDKIKVMEKFANDIKQILFKDYCYRSDEKLSDKNKRRIVVDVLNDLITEKRWGE